MKNKHTEGKWDYAVDGKESHIEFAIFTEPPREDGTRGICSVMDYGNRPEEDRANAKLIASGPDLLVACETAMQFLWDRDLRGVADSEEKAIIDLLTDAIKKATS
jgi:hypothetical protein